MTRRPRALGYAFAAALAVLVAGVGWDIWKGVFG